MVRVVTDSTALFLDPTIVRRYDISVVPVYVRFGEERFKLGLEIGPEEFLHRLRYSDVVPQLEAPPVDEIYTIYARLNLQTNKIVSLHTSAHLLDIYQQAMAASKMLLGRCDIAVLDSQTLSVGLGMLVEKTAQICQTETNLELIVRAVRRVIGNIYTVYYVETMKSIRRHKLISEAQTILGAMLGVMPFVTIEEGQLVIMEKALNTSQAVDKLVEFASEFINVERLAILHHANTLTDVVRLLQDRLALELGRTDFPTQYYDGSIGVFLGPDATGIVVLESEEEDETL